jgi:cell wall-associated NlpC family hydrolase
MSLAMPEPLGIDTSLPTEEMSLAAPQFETQIPIASFDNFRKAVDEGGIKPGGFQETLTGKANGDLRSNVVAEARKYLGMMYKWGGTNPRTSFDCSGLVQYVTGKFGLNLPRISYQQANSGRRTSIKNLRPGDLVAWDNSSRNNGADHIAFYIGNGMILEAASSGTRIRVRKLGRNEGAWGVALTYPGEK